MNMIIEVPQPICTSCNKRHATYHRITSGEKLCKLCLFNSVVKQTRKISHYYKMFRKNQKIVFAIRGDNIPLSIESFLILHQAVKDFELEYKILCPDNIVDCKIVDNEIKEHVKGKYEVYTVKYSLDVISKSFIHMVKYIDAVSVKIAKESEAESVVSTLFRDEMTMLSIMGFLLLSKTVFGEGMPVKYVESVKIVRPFYNVFSHDVIYLAYSLNDMVKLCKELNKIRINVDEYFLKAYKIFLKSPELMYSSSKSVELLQSFVIAKTSRCSVCGSFSDKQVCEYCEQFKISH